MQAHHNEIISFTELVLSHGLMDVKQAACPLKDFGVAHDACLEWNSDVRHIFKITTMLTRHATKLIHALVTS